MPPLSRPALGSALTLVLLSLNTPAQPRPTSISVCTSLRTYNNPDPHPPARCAISVLPGPGHIPECATLDHFGSALAAGGDFDGDGLPDLVIGGGSAADMPNQSTQAWLYLGSSVTPSLIFDGDGHSDLFGAALCFLPDLNGDGRDELAVGAPAAGSTGRVFVFFGREPQQSAPAQRRKSLSQADVILQGALNDGRFGAALAAGDVDGDGVCDLIVGAPGCPASDRSGFAGSVTWIPGGELIGSSEPSETPPGPRLLLSPQDRRTWSGLQAADRFGHSLAVAGELNGSPGVEILVGAPQVDPADLPRARSATGSGYAMVFSEESSEPLLSIGPPDAIYLALQFGEAFGAAVAAGRDLDGDGLPDLAVGAPLFTAVTDMDGVPTAGIDNGRVWFLSGANGRPLFGSHPEPGQASAQGQNGPTTRLVSRDPTAQLGWALAFVDDATGDGSADLLVGARGESSTPVPCPSNRKLAVGDALAGAIHVIDGRSGNSVARITGADNFDLLGQALAGHDMDGDGLAEVFCSASSWAPPRSPPSRAQQGQAYMMRGRDLARR